MVCSATSPNDLHCAVPHRASYAGGDLPAHPCRDGHEDAIVSLAAPVVIVITRPVGSGTAARHAIAGREILLLLLAVLLEDAPLLICLFSLLTPAQRHVGQDGAVLAARHVVYQDARQRNPQRWSGSTRNWKPVGAVTVIPDRDIIIRAAASQIANQCGIEIIIPRAPCLR
jgi:hypothetical protein